jgi:hypothetical protein
MAILQAAVVTIGTLVEAILLLRFLHAGARPLSSAAKDAWFGPVLVLKIFSVSVFGRPGAFLAQRIVLAHTTPAICVVFWIPALLLLALFWRMARHGGSAGMTIFAIAMASLVFDNAGTIGSLQTILIGAFRYYFTGFVLLWMLPVLALAGSKHDKSSGGRKLPLALCCLFLFWGAVDSIGYWSRLQNVVPDWQDQVAAWRKDPHTPIMVAPPGWKTPMYLQPHDHCMPAFGRRRCGDGASTANCYGFRMMMKPSGHYSITIVAIALVTWTAVLGAGAQKTPEKGAIVTGRVTFAETQLPARLAEVVLVRQPESASDLVPDETSASAPEPHKNEPEPPDRVVSISGRSGVDGSYTIADVPPGDYFVVAKMPGYVVPIATPSSRAEARDIARLTRDLPKVHLEANHTASVDLMLHHGAVVSGQVRFRDGSPAIGVPVSAKTAGKGEDLRVAYQPLLMAMQTDLRSGLLMGQYEAVTDDQGRYRLCGLPPGSYVVSTTLTVGGGMRMVQQGQHGFGGSQAGAPDVTLKVYQPSGFHESRAKSSNFTQTMRRWTRTFRWTWTISVPCVDASCGQTITR